jgi:hypothetical protein
VLLDAALRGQHQGRGAVDDARRVAGGDAAVLAEGRWELREPLERGIGPEVIVLCEDVGALARLHLDRHDFVGEPSRLPRGVGELLTAQGVAILRLARDAVPGRAILRRRGHRATAVRVEQRRPQRVLELALSEPQPGPQAADDMRSLAHALHPARQDDVGFLQPDHLATAHRRLDA